MNKRAPSSIGPLLAAQEAGLKVKLAEARARYAQSGDRGDAAETAVRAFLAENLSSRFVIGQGEIIDVGGRRSKQTDIVIATDDHPFRSEPADPGLFLVEGVFAAGEVKAQLTTGELSDAIKKGKTLKALEKSHVAGAMVFANPSDHARWVSGPPPFFVFAFESVVATTTLLNRLAAAGDPTPIDAVFVLGRGVVLNLGNGQGVRRVRLDDGSDATGWVWLEGVQPLLEYLGWLHSLPLVDRQNGMLLNYFHASASAEEGALVAFPQAERPEDPDPDATSTDS
jgi:hypothetical protein